MNSFNGSCAAPSLPEDEEERLAWLRLFRTEHIGPKHFFLLLRTFGTAKAVVESLAEYTAALGRKKPLIPPSLASIEREYASLSQWGATLLLQKDPHYPFLLRHIPDAPPLLTVKGRIDLLQHPMLAIVGSRNASLHGTQMTQLLATNLGQAGWMIVSGLARGIDTIAHKAAIATGTIAVIAGGIDSIYPPENKALYAQIANQGLIIAELPFGTPPRAHHFPQRNRIIAGLSTGTVVVEATLKSGSLITARMALDYNRELFAVPGSPLDARCQGPNSLIKQGALLTESANDVIQALAGPSSSTSIGNIQPTLAEPLFSAPSLKGGPDIHRHILTCMSPHPVAANEVIARADLPTEVVTTALLELELAGVIQRYPGNKVARVASL